MCSAISHTLSFQGDHGSTGYLCTIWSKEALVAAHNNGSIDGLEPIFE